MKFTESIKRAIEIIKLDTKVVEKVAKDHKSTTAGILILIIGGIISGIAEKDIVLITVTPIMVLITSFIGIGILHLIATLFGGKEEFIGLYRVLTHASILNWISILNIIPPIKVIVTIVVSIWSIIVNYVAIMHIYKLSRVKTVFVILIPIILFLIIGVGIVSLILIVDPDILATIQ